jgi:hypothetical protein
MLIVHILYTDQINTLYCSLFPISSPPPNFFYYESNELLPSKLQALSSNHSTEKQKEEGRKEGTGLGAG